MNPYATSYYPITASESEDRGRSAAEAIIYAVFVLSAVVAVFAAATQPIAVPSRLASTDCKTIYCA